MSEPVRILIVEDSPADADLATREIRKSLADCIFQIVETESEFLKALEKFNPDLILSDYHLPHFTGMDALRLTLERAPLTPLVIFTGSLSEDVAVDCMKAGAANYIIKENIKRLGIAVVHALEEKKVRSERKRAEKQLAQMKRLYATLSQVNQTIVRVRDRDDLYQSICNVAVQFGEFTLAWVGLLDEASGEVRPVSANGQDVKQWPFQMVNINKGALKDGLIATSLRTSKVETSEDAESDERIHALRKQFSKYNYHSSAAVPFRSRGRTIGVVCLVSSETGHFNAEEEVRLLEEMGLDISFALETMDAEAEREQAEEELQNSEKRFRALIENGRDNISLLAVDGTLLWESRSTFSTQGYAPNQFVGRNIFELMHPDDQGWTRELYTQLIQTPDKSQDGTFRLRHGDGTWRWIESTASNMLDEPAVQAIVINYRDITERKQSEIALKASEENYRNLAENSESAIAVLNRDGQVLYANPQGLRVWDDPQIVGKTIFDIFPSEYANRYSAAIKQVIDTQTGIVDEVGSLINGRLMWFRLSMNPLKDPDGAVNTLLLNAWDITERRLAEEKLLASERQMRALVTSLDDIVFEVDEQGTYLNVWAADENMLVQPSEQVLGRRIVEILGEENGRLFAEAVKRVLASGAPESIEYPMEVMGGQHWFAARISPIISPADSHRTASRLIRDITKRKQAEGALLASEERFRRYFELGLIGMAITSPGKGFIEVNDRICEILGYEKAELMQISWDALSHPDDLAADLLNFSRLRDGQVNGYSMEKRFSHKSGKIVHTNISVNCVRREDGSVDYALALMEDITGRKQAERQIQLQLQRMSALSEIDRAISSSLDMRLSLDVLLSEVLSQLEVDAASVLLLNTSSLMLEYIAGKGFRTSAVRQSRTRLGDGYAGRVGLERKLLHIPDLGEAGAQFKRSEFFKSENFVEYFGVPLVAKGMLKGVLEVFHRAHLDPDLDWLNYLETLGGQAAIAIDNVQLFEGLQQSNLELITAYDATIAGWSHAMDLRDKETEGHTQRVTELTGRLAVKMGVSPQELVQIRRGALLHDIGKLGVPDHILLKPGPLTEEEWGIMRQHPTYAHDMLLPIAYLQPALDIPYCHHEKWDGTGYPRRLSGEQIPLAARLFAVVDVWDALRSDRPYRESWSKEKTRAYILGQSGKHFDPRVANNFVDIIANEQSFGQWE